MRELVEYFKKNGVIFRSLNPLDKKRMGIKKRLKLYEGIELDNSYALVAQIERKSRFLRKDATELEDLAKKAQSLLGHAFKRKYLLIKAPLCSKAKEMLEEFGWRIYAFV